MPKYRRKYVPGGTYFFTLCLAEAGSTVLVDHVGILRWAFAEALAARPVRIDAAVVLPDHLHVIWTLPPGDADFSTRISQIKGRFTYALGTVGARQTRSQARRGERGVWQRRFWEHHIRNPADFERHRAYCWQDPVHHRLVRFPGEWAYSSFGRDLRRGHVPEGWMVHLAPGDYGERAAPALASAAIPA